MAAPAAEEGEQLIPGLPDELLLAQIVPRLPWYTRPVCRALSKSWRTVLDTRNPDLDLRTRLIQLPLLRGLFLFCTYDQQIFIADNDIHEPRWINGYQILPHWRKLPPSDGFVAPIGAVMLASSGMVYVWSASSWRATEGLRSVSKLDLGSAVWTWKKVLVPYAFSFHAVSFNGKMYVQRIRTADSQSGKEIVLEHDMATDICKEVESWNQSDLRVVVTKSAHSDACDEEMYAFEEEGSAENLRVVMYDAKTDSWRSKEEVPIPEAGWSELLDVKLLNGDCFEPAPDVGINIAWYDHESQAISWFNSCVGGTWVDIEINPFLEGRCLDYKQFIRGSMYGVFCDEEKDKEEDAEKQGDLVGLTRWTLMKGRINLENKIVMWEDVQEIGYFRERYYVDPLVIHAIDWYTVMT